MRKVFLYFAIAAVFCVIVACGNKSAANNNGQDSAEVTATEEAEPEKEVPIDQQTELTCDAYTIKVPEGWKARSRMVSSSCVLALPNPPFITASPNYSSSQSIDTYKADREKEGSKAQEDITANGNTYSVYYNENNEGVQYLGAATPKGDGIIYVTLSTGAHSLSKEEATKALENGLKAILKNITLK